MFNFIPRIYWTPIFCPLRKKNVGMTYGVETGRRTVFAEVRETTIRLTYALKKELFVAVHKRGVVTNRKIYSQPYGEWTKVYKYRKGKSLPLTAEELGDE